MLIEVEEKSVWYVYEDDNMMNNDINNNNNNNNKNQTSSSSLFASNDDWTTTMPIVLESMLLPNKYRAPVLVMYTVLALIVLGSFLVIFLLGYVFKQNKALIHNSVNIFILNIIFVDLLRCLVQMPIYSASIHVTLDKFTWTSLNININNNENNTNQIWSKPLQKSSNDFRANNNGMFIAMCNLNLTLGVLFEVVQLLSFLAISYERFKIVLSPFLNSNNRFVLAKILLALTWLVAVLLTALIVFLISILSDYANFSMRTNSCYMDIYSLMIDVYYRPSTHELAYDYGELRLRNLQIDCLAYFKIAINLIAFAFSGYFYTRIIFFLKFHEQNVFASLSARKKSAHFNSNKVDAAPTVSTNGGSTHNQSVVLVKPTIAKGRFAIVDENGDVLTRPAAATTTGCSAIPLAIPPPPQLPPLVLPLKPSVDPPAAGDSKMDETFVVLIPNRPAQKLPPIVVNTTKADGEDNERKSSSSSSDSAAINIFNEDGQVTSVKKKLESEASVKPALPDAIIKLDGDVCIVSHGGNKNREKGKRRLEARTAKKTFIIMLSFLSCQLMSLFTIVIQKMPIFTQNSQLTIDEFNQSFYVCSLFGVSLTILSFMSCFFNSFTFILVTDFFKYECARNMRSLRNFLVNKLKLKAKKATNNS